MVSLALFTVIDCPRTMHMFFKEPEVMTELKQSHLRFWAKIAFGVC